ncbi:DegT/DnrJ/EryC1/StrS family aminotransferase [Pontibacter cellulosilyticus]|uniref:DegT/DnrJ/EryC1/StrS family aminotransferase n=1 Tax=Pontibacter cellulosilyticus TaxID=1720253 RepID=A0A923N4A6_9BACT|nr:DegT/DnrJ/EryC1/StrS family aminotransferase [Pontibacter cellulosilyticus]MBC5991604.1 DegT/DnrJ/EryC1/StrS family aminotransferase [Pontibacter cellulosilyticus]
MITKSPTDCKSLSRTLLFTSSARVAWGHLLKAINIQPPYCVLLPSYIGFTEREGSGVFDPISETNTLFKFYPLDEKLAVDFDKFDEMLQSEYVKVALVIHYFGICQNDVIKISELCKKNDVLLVEDCAHAFQLGLANQKLGIVGDFSFYSLHKYLATNSGGILQVNNPIYQLAEVSEEQQIDESVLKQYIITDIQAVADIRKVNYLKYQSMLQNIPGIEILYTLKDAEVPHNFPIKVKNGMREKLYFYLMNKEIPTIALYYRLISEINEEEFPLSFKISNEILNLPVHQDTTLEDIECICSAIRQFFTS